MFGTDLKQLVVLDDIRDKLDMVDSDIIPETCTHPVISGIDNVAANISSTTGSNYTNAYTTFPLSPLQGRVHYIKDSFINCTIDVNIGIRVCSNILKDIVLAVGPRDTASIFNQLQLMIDNNVIWNTSFQQLESAIDMAGLPASVVDHSPNYATIDKLLNNKQTPMQLITIPANNYQGASSQLLSYHLEYQFSIDLNRLCVPLSNLAFITANMGNLRLRCYFNNFHQSFFVMQLPQGAYIPGGITAGAFTQLTQASSLLSLDPIPWGTSSKDGSNKWTLTNPYILKAPYQDTVTLNTTVTSSTRSDISTYKLSSALIPVQFTLLGDAANPFMQVVQVQICQSCFDLKDESYNLLCDYFQQTGKVILPIQAWSTTQFNNGSLTAGSQYSSSWIGSTPGHNITAIAVTSCVGDAQACLVNPYRTQFQALLDGKPLNSVPYSKVDGRAIQDFTNACIDTDHEEINTDYLYSMQFPQFYANGTSSITDNTYFYTKDGEGDSGATNELSWFSQQGFLQGIGTAYQKNPNLFMYIFQTAIPDSFHTGMCIIEYSNRQALFRFTSNDSGTTNAKFTARFYPTAGTTVDGSGVVAFPSGIEPMYPSMPNISNRSINLNISSLCDECIVLDYDSNVNTCTGGYLSFTKPYVKD